MVAFSVAAFMMALQLLAHLVKANAESVKMPAACENMSYCLEKGEDYPEKEINILYETQQLSRMVYESRGTKDIGHRQSFEFSITRDLCQPETIDAAVYYIVDQNSKTRVVVQLAGVLDQKFKMESCKKPGPITESVSMVQIEDIKKMEMYCEDILYQYEFYVLSDDKERLEKAVSRSGIPVACACKYRNSEYTISGNLKNWN